MTKRSVGLFLLSLAAFGSAVTGEENKCLQCPGGSLRGEHFALLDDCAQLHANNQRNLESWASANCGTSLCYKSYRPLSCTTEGSGMTVVGELDYHCDCTLMSSGSGTSPAGPAVCVPPPGR